MVLLGTLPSTSQLRITLAVFVTISLILITLPAVSGSTPPVQISTSTDIEEPMPGEPVTINTTISNAENNNDKNAVVSYVWLRDGGGLDLYRQSEDVGVIAPGGSLSIPFTYTFTEPGRKHLDVEIAVRTENGDNSQTFKKPIYIDVTKSDLRGDIRLTSTQVTGQKVVTVEGDAANIGGTDVESVLVSIPDTATVSPRPPTGEYYVGGIETSEFGTFELTASVDSDTDTIPVNISYIATGNERDDQRVRKTQQIPIQQGMQSPTQTAQPEATNANQQSPIGELPLVPIAVIAVLVASSLGGFMLWRRQ